MARLRRPGERYTRAASVTFAGASFLFSEESKNIKKKKSKTVWAYLDGKKLVDVVQAALDNNMTVEELKATLVRENPSHKVTFKVE